MQYSSRGRCMQRTPGRVRCGYDGERDLSHPLPGTGDPLRGTSKALRGAASRSGEQVMCSAEQVACSAEQTLRSVEEVMRSAERAPRESGSLTTEVPMKSIPRGGWAAPPVFFIGSDQPRGSGDDLVGSPGGVSEIRVSVVQFLPLGTTKALQHSYLEMVGGRQHDMGPHRGLTGRAVAGPTEAGVERPGDAGERGAQMGAQEPSFW